MPTLKIFLLRIYSVLGQFGFDPLKIFRSILGLPPYIADLISFTSAYSGKLSINPCLSDRLEDCGSIGSEYFWQDLLVARWIHDANPHRHVDVGSRVDGFVAHIASFRNLEVLDIRTIDSSVPGITFRQADLTSKASLSKLLSNSENGYCDSLSCLHVIEHLGLGRYGDKIDPFGYLSGFVNLTQLLQPSGSLYISCPVGYPQVEFNSHRVFSPYEILKIASNNNLHLEKFVVCNPREGIRTISLLSLSHELKVLASLPYSLAIMHFVKSE